MVRIDGKNHSTEGWRRAVIEQILVGVVPLCLLTGQTRTRICWIVAQIAEIGTSFCRGAPVGREAKPDPGDHAHEVESQSEAPPRIRSGGAVETHTRRRHR